MSPTSTPGVDESHLPLHQCPSCHLRHVHRSRTQSTWESWRRRLTGNRPYRCRNCGGRWWALDIGAQFDEEAAALALADGSLQLPSDESSRSHTRWLTDLDLDALDKFGPRRRSKPR